MHRLYPVGISVDRQVGSDVVLQNYHIPAGVSGAPQPLQQMPSPADLCLQGATDTAPPHLSADLGQGARLFPGSRPLCVPEARVLSSPALAGQQELWHQVPQPGLRLWPAPVPGAAPGRDRDAASAAPRERAWATPGPEGDATGQGLDYGRVGGWVLACPAPWVGTTGFSLAAPSPWSRVQEGGGG